MTKLSLEISRESLPRFFYLLQQGFVVTTETGRSIKDLLCQQMGIDENYLKDRIQTLFLNGMPVDDFEKAFIQDNVTLVCGSNEVLECGFITTFFTPCESIFPPFVHLEVLLQMNISRLLEHVQSHPRSLCNLLNHVAGHAGLNAQ